MPGLFDKVMQRIDEVKDSYIEASHDIAKRPELGRKEFYACERLSGLLVRDGFRLWEDTGLSYETAFAAHQGDKGTKIAFLCEYDALPEIGHACGHNLIGTISALAAVGVSSVLSETGGQVLVYGTPAEEGGDEGCAKEEFVKKGMFDGVSCALMVHPYHSNEGTMPSLAVKCYTIEFFGQTAHASACPELGVNALDAMVLLFSGVGLMRQQMLDGLRIHGIITHGGVAPNIIPGYTRAEFYVRGKTKALAEETLQRLVKVAEGAAVATGCTFKAHRFCNDFDDMLVTESLDDLFYEEAAKFGFDRAPRAPGAVFGSTDAGNVSQVIPLLHPLVRTVENPAALHTAEFAAECITPYADNALVNAAKALAAVGLRLLTDEELVGKIWADYKNLRSIKDCADFRA